MKAVTALVAVMLTASALSFGKQIPSTSSEADVQAQITGLGHNTGAHAGPQRGPTVRSIALEIRKLTPSSQKVNLAFGLANFATEGDLGDGPLQEVATTLAVSLRETPMPDEQGEPNFAYQELAQLQRFERLRVSLIDPHYKAALNAVDKILVAQSKADFTLDDLSGKPWTLSSLKGKVVIVNFWATWCPPCRQEMPDLEQLSKEFGNQGLVVLAISDEAPTKVQPFIKKQGYTFPVLLDPKRKVNEMYHMQGIPHSFVYNRQGRLVAQAIDMRTKGQFLRLLSMAGVKTQSNP